MKIVRFWFIYLSIYLFRLSVYRLACQDFGCPVEHPPPRNQLSKTMLRACFIFQCKLKHYNNTCILELNSRFHKIYSSLPTKRFDQGRIYVSIYTSLVWLITATLCRAEWIKNSWQDGTIDPEFFSNGRGGGQKEYFVYGGGLPRPILDFGYFTTDVNLKSMNYSDGQVSTPSWSANEGI